VAIMRRHDLLRVEPAAWDAILQRQPRLVDLPLVANWARRHWPVIVRRRMAHDAVDGVPAALPLPPCYGKQRLAFTFASDAAVAVLPPLLLCDAAQTASPEWQPVVAALLDLGDKVGMRPRVFGALLWEHVTGLPYLTAQSDLDLLWSIPDERAAVFLLERLVQLDAEAPVRLDGEVELPDGAGVNWRELAQTAGDQLGEVLAKTMDGVEIRPRSGLFRTIASPL
jgi:phosphoribosyl-dephospho-CoA transferase